MGNPDFPEDDDELELEPVDPAILAHERARAASKTDDAFKKVEFDEIYEDPGADPLIDVDALRQFRFQIKHLLMLTAGLALVMTLFQLVANPCSGVAILMVVFLVAGWSYVIRRERLLRERKERMRAEFEAGRMPSDVALPALPDEVTPPVRDFYFQFSTKQLLLTLTGAALAMGLLTLIPNKGTVALILGVIAIVGLIVHAVGFEPPAIVVLAWWLLLVCYLALGVWIAMFGDGEDAAAQRTLLGPAAFAAAFEPGVPRA